MLQVVAERISLSHTDKSQVWKAAESAVHVMKKRQTWFRTRVNYFSNLRPTSMSKFAREPELYFTFAIICPSEQPLYFTSVRR